MAGTTDQEDAAFEASFEVPYIEPSIWHMSNQLQHVRQYAEHHGCAPDALLGVVLSRVAAMARKGTRISSGFLNDVTPNLLVGMVGFSGAGKSVAIKLGAQFLPGPEQDPRGSGGGVFSAPADPPLVERHLGSGEGIAEVYMGPCPTRPARGRPAGRRRSGSRSGTTPG
jgi:hypothetical protein